MGVGDRRWKGGRVRERRGERERYVTGRRSHPGRRIASDEAALQSFLFKCAFILHAFAALSCFISSG
jgi:hypothetical protein